MHDQPVERNIHVVALGGGGGTTHVLHAVAPFAASRTAVIAVTDTGRSTGLARQIGGMPAPGDLRATIAAFASDQVMAETLNHRFDGAGIPALEGMAFGNLLIAALTRVTGDFAAAVEHTARLAAASVRVLPVSVANATLCAELADSTRVEGEFAVRAVSKPSIARLFLREPAAAYPPALAAIRNADLVALGPGSLWTSVLACVQFAGVTDALADCRGTVAYVCNSTTQPGQTDGYRCIDHVRRIVETLGPGVLDAVLINGSDPDPAMLQQYAEEGLHLLRPDDDEIAAIRAMGVLPLVRELTTRVGPRRVLWNKQDTIRYETGALGAALHEVVMMKGKTNG
ncbi:MAG: YvcK family protein [Roseiflexus sp.]|uniref:gluconeogenesis factor YvcK family protein n=1 Tax=Roseiflexus sp. TaxID=2562120 RepID=UPI0025F7BEE8|nr:gluconeogenesis factor YvcK family protein [Roseiflexus sp.]MCL6543026.1 YvcK family protein [Roseiflexus sp.]